MESEGNEMERKQMNTVEGITWEWWEWEMCMEKHGKGEKARQMQGRAMLEVDIIHGKAKRNCLVHVGAGDSVGRARCTC